MAIFTFIPSLWAAQAEFYVSPSGSDKNPGTKAKPFQTITHARDSVAKINSNMTGDIVVHLAGGAYEISESVVFDVNDSGTNGHKVIYKAIAGQTPMVSGGKAIKNWEIHDKEKNIYKATVAGLEFRQIYVNGVRGIRARHAEARKNNSSDWGEIEIHLRRSTDGGKTWADSQHIAHHGARLEGNPRKAEGGEKEQTVNNPVAIVDRETGAIEFLYCINYARCYAMRSTDDGLTWSQPVDCRPPRCA